MVRKRRRKRLCVAGERASLGFLSVMSREEIAFILIFNLDFGIGERLTEEWGRGRGVLFVSGCQATIVRSRRKKK